MFRRSCMSGRREDGGAHEAERGRLAVAPGRDAFRRRGHVLVDGTASTPRLLHEREAPLRREPARRDDVTRIRGASSSASVLIHPRRQVAGRSSCRAGLGWRRSRRNAERARAVVAMASRARAAAAPGRQAESERLLPLLLGQLEGGAIGGAPWFTSRPSSDRRRRRRPPARPARPRPLPSLGGTGRGRVAELPRRRAGRIRSRTSGARASPRRREPPDGPSKYAAPATDDVRRRSRPRSRRHSTTLRTHL